MKTKIYLVRHGKTSWNEQGKIQGWTDIPLSPNGKKQALDLVPKFKKIHVGAIYSSTLSRAYQTAKPIADDKTMAVVQIENLKEGRFGVFEGLVWNEIEKHELIKARKEYDWYNDTTGGGESIRDVYERASASLDQIVANHLNETIIVVSHGLVMKTLALHMGFIEKTDFEGLKILNAEPYLAEYSHTESSYTPIDFPLHFYRE